MGFIASCYVAIFGLAAAMIGYRHFAALRKPNDFNGSMAAGGDLILEIEIGVLLQVPTFLLAWAIRERKEMYISFSMALFCFQFDRVPQLGIASDSCHQPDRQSPGSFCMYRAFGTPVVMIWLAVGRALARFQQAKRFTGLALVIEAGTLVLAIALLFFFGKNSLG